MVYKTTHILSGRFYVGMHSTKNVDDGYFGSGKWIKTAIKKYGKDAFKREILFDLPSYGDMVLKEKEIVNDELLSDPLCMNFMFGGKGGWRKLNANAEDAFLRRQAGGLIGGKHPNTIAALKRHSGLHAKKSADTKKKKYGEDYFQNIAKYERTEETRLKQRNASIENNSGKANLGLKRVKIKCPHCEKEGSKSTMVRWHFENCKKYTSVVKW